MIIVLFIITQIIGFTIQSGKFGSWPVCLFMICIFLFMPSDLIGLSSDILVLVNNAEYESQCKTNNIDDFRLNSFLIPHKLQNW